MEAELIAIRRRWKSQGVAVREGLSDESIAAFESRYHVRLPESVRRFYQFMDGIESGDVDEEFISFWSLSEVAPVPEKLSDYRGTPDYGGIESSLPNASSYFVFADHSIWAHVYAVKLSNTAQSGPIVWIGGGNSWAILASSFDEFIHRYAADASSVLFP